MIEYAILAGSVGIFFLVLIGVGLVAVVRSLGARSRSGPASFAAPAPSPGRPARTFLDSMGELMKEQAATELEKAFGSPETNIHIPPFLAAKKTAGADAPKAE